MHSLIAVIVRNVTVVDYYVGWKNRARLCEKQEPSRYRAAVIKHYRRQTGMVMNRHKQSIQLQYFNYNGIIIKRQRLLHQQQANSSTLELFDAVKGGDTAAVRRLLAKIDVDVNWQDQVQ